MVTIFIKIFGVHFRKSTLDNSNCDKRGHSFTQKKIQYFEQSSTLFRMRKKEL